MTGQTDEQSHLSWRFPGNATAIEGEIWRLDDVKERLWATGDTLRRLSVDGWAGEAYDAFDEVQHRLGRQWLAVGDSHADAARALEQYRATLLELRRRLADLNTATPAALADMTRWNEQLDSAGHTAALAIRKAAAALADLPRIFTPDISPPIAVPTTPKSIVAPVPRDRLDPRFATADQSRFRRRVQELSKAVLAADYIAIPLA